MYLVKVYITYKESIVDPQAEAIKKAIYALEHPEVASVRLGKYFELTISGTKEQVVATVDTLCEELLANVVLETYRYELVEVNA